MKKALITGITGQDGAYLAKLLLIKGYEVVGVSPQHSTMNYWRLEEMGLLDHPDLCLDTLDITCTSAVTDEIAMGEYHEIYNLAAQSFVQESFKSPSATLNINLMGVLNILDAIKNESIRTKLYQASTSEMFGLVNVEAQDEETPFHPRSPYAVAKAGAHYLVQNYREAYGLHASCGILFNHESPYRGVEFVTRKITDGVAQIVTGKKENLLLGNMDAMRDWGHAEDYVHGMWLMLQEDKPDDYVLATGEANSVCDFAKAAFDVVGLDYKDHIIQDEKFMRPSDVPLLRGNPAKAERVLNWKRHCNFDVLIREMINYDLHRHGHDPIKDIAEGLRSY